MAAPGRGCGTADGRSAFGSRLLGLLSGLLLATASVAGSELAIPPPPNVPAKSLYLLDHTSGEALAERHARQRLHPASLTKLMTVYVAFKALADGRIRLVDSVLVSEKAWRTGGSRMFIEVGTEVTVEDLLQGVIVQSGNDASIALAEYVAGSEAEFVELMNGEAAALGLADTAFRNSTGLPASDHYSTAHDLAMLARALITEFPEYYHWYSQREFTYNGIAQYNRNVLLRRDDSVDGLKTGYTQAAGYCLVSSAERGGMRLIAVVLGMETATARAEGSAALLDYGFQFFETRKLYAKGEPVAEARVWKGAPASATIGPDRDLYVTIPRGEFDALKATLDVARDLVAPVAADARAGELAVSLNGRNLATLPLVALQGVPEGSLLTRFVDELKLRLE
jgi:serine-type D-Ala-D-Ala carboxypeptidase (penicillin-binding protein 5/6)